MCNCYVAALDLVGKKGNKENRWRALLLLPFSKSNAEGFKQLRSEGGSQEKGNNERIK